jgi:hypothetical protein
MPIVDNAALKNFDLPGLNHRTLAGPEHGLKSLELWGQTIASGAGLAGGPIGTETGSSGRSCARNV